MARRELAAPLSGMTQWDKSRCCFPLAIGADPVAHHGSKLVGYCGCGLAQYGLGGSKRHASGRTIDERHGQRGTRDSCSKDRYRKVGDAVQYRTRSRAAAIGDEFMELYRKCGFFDRSAGLANVVQHGALRLERLEGEQNTS